MHETLVRDRLKDLGSLPTLPLILSKLIKALQSESSSIYDITEILRYDQAIAARIVSIANSPFFGCTGKINSIDQAILMLGFDMVKSISLGVSVFGLLPAQYPQVKKMWAHSYGVATLAGLMCSKVPVADKGICFLSGLLHDIGRAVFLKLYKSEYTSLAGEQNLLAAETARFQCSHQEAGAWFLENLSFPEEIVSAVLHHHTIPADVRHKGIVTSVYLAEGVIGLLNQEFACDAGWADEHTAVFSGLGLGPDDLKEFRASLAAEEKNMIGFFEL